MKKYLMVFWLIIAQITWGIPVYGKTANPINTDRRLTDLSNRFNSLEANWGRFQIGGNFSIKVNSSFEDPVELNHYSTPEFKQELGLFLDALVDKNLMLFLRMSHQGGWGLYYENWNSSNSPIVSPLQIDEAFFKFEYPKSINYFGRFRFSLGPFGVISDFFANPIEGIAMQRTFRKFHIIGLFSRVNTQYLPGTNQIESGEEYLATRVGWSNSSTIIGLNMVPNGVTGEKDFSVDWSYTSPQTKTALELAWYSFNSSQYTDFQADWNPGILISHGIQFKNSLLQIKIGYFGPKFTPSYSCLAHSSGDNREWFAPNSKGGELLLQTGLGNGLTLDNRLVRVEPVINYNQSKFGYRLLSSITKNFSPVNQIQLGAEVKSTQEKPSNQVFMRWNVQF